MDLPMVILLAFNALLSIGLLSTYVSRKISTKGNISKEGGDPPSKVLVILPVKGEDYEMEENFRSLLSQDYKHYDILAVVDDEGDQSVGVLQKLGIKYMVSDSSCTGCSGKVRAIYSALLRYRDYDCYAVVDSDVRVNGNWLSSLVWPLSDPGVGASTTFPVFYPRGGFWSKVKMYWGLVGQSMMESNLTRFLWGGSMCFRRDILDEESLVQFSHSLSDDVAILRTVKGRSLKVMYVPTAKAEIHSLDDFRTFQEWSIRQTAFSIYSTDRVFLFGVLVYGVSVYLLLSSIILALLGQILFLVFLFPFALNSVLSYRKLPVKVAYFPVITFLLQFIYLGSLVAGRRAKQVTWRGNTYMLKTQ